MNIQQKTNGNRGSFHAQVDNAEAGEIEYVLRHDHKMELTHTEVNEQFQGKNIGGQLVEHAVSYARSNGLKIIATCTFAHAYIQKHETLQDVLYR